MRTLSRTDLKGFRRVPSSAVDLRLPPGAAQRRRLVVLAYVSLAALLVGAVVGSDADEPASPSSEATSAAEESDPLEGLSLRQRVGQLIVLRFDGGERPTYVEKALGRGEAAGRSCSPTTSRRRSSSAT